MGNPKDFSARQIRTSQLIASGGNGTEAQLLVYSASDTTSLAGEIPNSVVTNVGTDVFLFVSGSASKDGSDRTASHPAVTLFGGDVVISGTLYADKQVIEIDETVTGSLTVSGSLVVSQSIEAGQHLHINSSGGHTVLTTPPGFNILKTSLKKFIP